MPDYYALLGVSPEGGGNEQAAAEPVDSEMTTAPEQEPDTKPKEGGQEQEVAEPAEGEEQENANGGEQSAEERHRMAAERKARQQQEQEAQIEQRMKAQYEGQIGEILSAMGLTDPNNENKPVTNLQEFRAWQEGQKTAKLRRDLRSGNLTEESLQTAIMQMPQVKALAERAAAAEQAVRQQEYQQNVGIQMAAIKRLNPEIGSVDDIIQLPCGPKFAEYVRKGLNFEEAYRLADADGIAQRARRAGVQQARNDAAGKAHMRPMATAGTPGGVVPEKERKMYRLLNPNMTDEEILKAYENKRKD